MAKYIIQISEDTTTDSGGKLIKDLYLQKFDNLDIPKVVKFLNSTESRQKTTKKPPIYASFADRANFAQELTIAEHLEEL